MNRMPIPRGRHLFLFDLLATLIAIVGAFVLRFDASDPIGALRPYLPVVLLPLVTQPVANVAFGLYRREWRYASVREMFGVVAAVAASSLASGLIFLLLSGLGAPGTAGMPRSFFLLEGLIALTLIGGSRFTLRWVLETNGRSGGTDEERAGTRTLVYGAGEAGASVARMAERDQSVGMTVVGFLDDDTRKRSSVLFGRRIYGGLDRLAEATRKTRASALLVAMPSAPGSIVRRAIDQGEQLGLSVRIVPSLDELLRDPSHVGRVRPVQVDDLLRREPIRTDADAVAGYLNGASVLVTGGGGSIGSELARQILGFGPRMLTILDHSEVGLWASERELNERAGIGGPEIRAVLADVRSPAAIERILRAAEPDVVFHAAALKHVPICELQPAEAVLTNIVGTRNVLDACEALGVARFVLISTDKAVQPVSVMGSTKRIAELLTIERAERLGRPFMAVRFGNVLASSGSVVPIFQHQLEQGLPLTITHPDATRYFMTIPEAVTLILEAGSDSMPGETYLLDMGDPVRIVDLARDVCRLAGVSADDVEIQYTGLRPGERLHERLLFDHETVEPSTHDRIWRTRTRPSDQLREPVDRLVASLERAALDGDDRAVREHLASSGVIRSTETVARVTSP